jgi:tRNA threonylcarbamoyladenosine biosynthesis protein TsaE
LAGEPIELWHCDLYRLEHAREALALGLEEAFGRAIVLIEWPERLGGDVPEEALVLTLQQAPQAPQARIAHMQAGTIWQERLDLVKKIYEQGVDPFKL